MRVFNKTKTKLWEKKSIHAGRKHIKPDKTTIKHVIVNNKYQSLSNTIRNTDVLTQNQSKPYYITHTHLLYHIYVVSTT